MTSYFDALTREVREAADQFDEDEDFIQEVAYIESGMYRDVTLVTGDREFPDDLRQDILNVLAVHAVYQPGALGALESAAKTVKLMRSSTAIEKVHSLFHELARRRIETRFGWLQDSPTQILLLRDEWEEEKFGS